MKKILLVLGILFCTALKGFSTSLPPEVTKYITTEIPGTEIRFDGLITLPDKTTYLPLLPALKQNVEKLEISYVYPKNSNLKKKAEIIVFNNNYVLLKVIKDKSGVTVSKINEFPIAVKTGILPQDLLVPKGLYIPESLEGIIGDLKIPIGANQKAAVKDVDQAVQDEASQFLDKKNPITVPKVAALKNKLYFISNYDSNYIRVINSDNTQPMYSLKLEGIPKAIISVNNKYLMIATRGKTYLDIVDIQREEIAKQIDLTIEPAEIAIDTKRNLAYVAAKDNGAIFIVDIRNMELKQKVAISSYPINLSFEPNSNKLIYQDKKTTKLYVMDIEKDYTTTPIFGISNVSKIITTQKAIYAISRTQNLLYVMSYPEATIDNQLDNMDSAVFFRSGFTKIDKNIPAPIENYLLTKKEITQKPVDMIEYNGKLYILGAEKNQLNVYDINTNTLLNTIDLPIGGFSTKLTRVEDSNYVVISNTFEEKYLIFDLNTLSTIQQVPLNTKINSLVIIPKQLAPNNAPKATEPKKEIKQNL